MAATSVRFSFSAPAQVGHVVLRRCVPLKRHMGTFIIRCLSGSA